MYKIVICDDSESDAKAVGTYVKDYAKKKRLDFNISEFTSPQALMCEIKENIIGDIYILDVEMPEVDGFEIADEIRTHSQNAVIIFLTSHDEFALSGYKVKALRYIIKLKLEGEIAEALDAAIAEVKNEDEKTVVLRRYNDYYKIPLGDVISVSKVSRRLIIETRLFGELSDIRGLKEFFALLNDERFLFIDKSCFINIDYVSQISGLDVILTTGKSLSVSRRSMQTVKQTLLEHWGM